MKRFELSSDSLLGYAPIDDEHHQLVVLINELAALPKDASAATFAQMFEDLAVAFEAHCTSEMEMLQEFGFPDREDHEKHHDDMIAQTRKLGRDAKAGEFAPKMRAQLLSKVAWIFLEDAIGEDLKVKTFLTGRGIIKTS